MALHQPTESELRNAGSLKWTGMKSQSDVAPLGAWVAEMDFGTAPAVENRLIRSIREGFLGYPPPWAGEAMTDALVRFQERHFGWVLKPGWVRGSLSVLTALHSMIDKLTRPGSAVVVPTPSYMPFLTIPQGHGREMVPVPSLHTPNNADPEAAWALNLDGIEDALKAGAGLVILCNPWNPTGRVFSVEELRALNDVVSRYDALVFSDEIHSPLVFGDPASFVSYASLGPEFAAHTVTAVAASKAWNVAGLMAAQLIIPDAKLRERWDTEVPRSSATALGSVAATTAYLEGATWLQEVLGQVSKNLDLLSEALDGTAVDYSRPQATYLAWLGFEKYALQDAPAKLLLNDYGVAVNDGLSLGEPYDRWIRVNAAMSAEPWKRAVEQIARFANEAPLH